MSVPAELNIRHSSGQGWSETYHYNSSSFGTVAADIQQLATLRAAMLTTDCSITHARVGTTTKRLVTIVPLNGGQGYPGQIAPPTAPLECAYVFYISNPDVGYNRKFIRGFDAASVNGEMATPSSAFNSASGLWENYLFTSGLWNVVGTLGSPTTQHNLSGLSPNGPRGILFSSADNIGGPGSVIRIHRATVPGYNGTKTILSQQLVGSVYNYTAGGATPAAPDSSLHPYATTITTFDQPILSVVFSKISRRGVGRPFGLLRGRRETLYSLRP